MLTMEQIIDAASKASGVSVHDIKGPYRHSSYMEPRMLCYLIARQKTHMSYPKIGMAIGYRDHTTIMHGVKSVQEKLKRSVSLRDLCLRTMALLPVDHSL